ncbi:MAG: hypothetical protein ACOC0P_03415 [Planctomycetota bacterium]
MVTGLFAEWSPDSPAAWASGEEEASPSSVRFAAPSRSSRPAKRGDSWEGDAFAPASVDDVPAARRPPRVEAADGFFAFAFVFVVDFVRLFVVLRDPDAPDFGFRSPAVDLLRVDDPLFGFELASPSPGPTASARFADEDDEAEDESPWVAVEVARDFGDRDDMQLQPAGDEGRKGDDNRKMRRLTT